MLGDKIALCQIPIETDCKIEEEIDEKLKKVITNDMGHYF